MDESNPHMHLVYIPVVHTVDKMEMKLIKFLALNFGKAKIVTQIFKIITISI